MNYPNTIMIVEDELVIAENTKFLIIELYPNAKVTVAGGSVEAQQLIDEKKPDIILLDIRLGTKDNGIDFSKKLHEASIPFIFLTAHGDQKTISNAIKMEPLGYIIKPVSRQDLYVNLQLALSKIESNTYYVFKDGVDDVRILEKEIVYLKVEGNYTEIHTSNKRYVVRKSMKKVIDELSIELICTHRNFHVNPNFIKEVNTFVHLTIGKELPVSRNYKKEIRERLFK